MCISPSSISVNDQWIDVACGSCWQCRAAKIDDYTGRALAEAEFSDAAFSMTLTYRNGSPNSQTLVYRDIQLMFKRLRKDGYSVRYLVAGEYGSQLGRAHWHCVLFFTGKVPDLDVSPDKFDIRRFDWSYWPHGFVQVYLPDENGLRYTLKYTQKTRGQVAEGHFSLSKKPPLGSSYFISLGAQYADLGSLPPEPFYEPRGSIKPFFLPRAVSRVNLLQSFAYHFVSKRGRLPRLDVLPEWVQTDVYSSYRHLVNSHAPEHDPRKNIFHRLRGYFDGYPQEEFFQDVQQDRKDGQSWRLSAYRYEQERCALLDPLYQAPHPCRCASCSALVGRRPSPRRAFQTPF